ncbi:MAG: adenosine kinase [Alphaproteobacteria bacterium]|nr:adenosine kinase [Alphaproteobacteria bacterium]
MSQNSLDVIGVGNAIVDVLAKADDAFLKANDIPKGGMILIDEDQARDIYSAMATGVEVSGGSAANTIACVASLGGNGAFVGKVASDALGEIFGHDLRALGVEYKTSPLREGPATGRCLINVTPDAQRSMTTFLGAAGFVAPSDIDPTQITRAAITFFEGYLFEQPIAREAFVRACAIAKEAGKRTALTLSDAGCVERNFEMLHEFIGGHVDILLANDMEAAALFGSDDVNAIADKARKLCPLTAVTMSEKGSVLIPRDGELVTIAPITPGALEDTTGAGDAYAAGLLFGLARGFSLEKAGALGSLAASEVISHFGARPAQPLKALAEKAGLL